MSALGVLRRPQFRRIFFASSVSALGDQIVPVALAFAVLGITHSAVDLGIVLAARLVPLAVLALVGGAWADRLPRRSVMVVSDLLRLLTQGGFALLLLLPAPGLGAMIALQAANGAATAFFRPASSGLLQEAVPPELRQSANALLSATNNLSTIFGPAIAAALVAFAGYAWAFGIDALSFGLSAVLLAGVAVAPRPPAERVGLLREIGEGIGEVVRRRWPGIMILGFAFFQLVALSAFGVLGPLVAERDYAGATTWAIVTVLSGVGALAGDAIALRFRPRRPLLASNLVVLAAVPLFVALAVQAPVVVLGVCGLLWGCCFSISNTLWFTTLQREVPDRLMARVSSLDWMGSLVLRPIGLAVLPLIAASLGAEPVLVAVAVLTALVLLATSFLPSVIRVRGDGPPAEA